HNLQLGEQQFLAKAADLTRPVFTAEAREDDEQTVGIPEDAQPAGIIPALGRQQTGSIQEFESSRRRFFGMKMGSQPVEALVRNLSDAHLAALAGGRVRLDTCQPVEDGALARACETSDADFHESG